MRVLIEQADGSGDALGPTPVRLGVPDGFAHRSARANVFGSSRSRYAWDCGPHDVLEGPRDLTLALGLGSGAFYWWMCETWLGDRFSSPPYWLMTVPPLADRARPALSETLTGIRHPARCQSCSLSYRADSPLARWLEHDAWDRIPVAPEPLVVVVLCKRCSDRLIEPHPRLYTPLENGVPVPGCMGVCLACVSRDGVACTKDPRGRSLEFTWEGGEPIYAHVRVAKPGRSGWRYLYPGPVKSCSGREAPE